MHSRLGREPPLRRRTVLFAGVVVHRTVQATKGAARTEMAVVVTRSGVDTYEPVVRRYEMVQELS